MEFVNSNELGGIFGYRSFIPCQAREKGNAGFKTTCTTRGSAERGGEGAEGILSFGGEGDGIFWSGGGAVFGVTISRENRLAVSEVLPDFVQVNRDSGFFIRKPWSTS
jgi:hypothetical protein